MLSGYTLRVLYVLMFDICRLTVCVCVFFLFFFAFFFCAVVANKNSIYRVRQKSIPLKHFANFSRTIERYDINFIHCLLIQLFINVKSFTTLST